MARTAQARKSANVPATRSEKLPAVAQDFFDGPDGFGGVDSDDIALPRFTILQALSPQCNKRSGDYVVGAEPGMIINNATNELYDELPVIVAAYQRRHVEWVPRVRGGGLVKDHGEDGSILDACVQSEDDGSYWTGEHAGEGNNLVITGTWYVLNPKTMSSGFIAMGNTHFTASRKIMAAMRDTMIYIESLDKFRPAPLYAKVWTLSARERKNDKGEWFTWKATPGEWAYAIPTASQVIPIVRKIQTDLEGAGIIIDMAVGEEPQESDSTDAAM